jgi:tetratricopeptide (TPR) repeat protein
VGIRSPLRSLLWGSFALACAGAAADQTSPALAELFEHLKSSTGPQQAETFEQQIWQLWLEGSPSDTGDQLQNARAAMSVGDLAQAAVLLDKLVKQSPHFAEVWNQRALLRFLQNDYARSLADIEEALNLEPRHFGALAGRGQCYLRLEKFEEALTWFEAASVIHPWLPDVQRNIEMLRVYLNDVNRGI